MTATAEYAARYQFNAQRTGEPEALAPPNRTAAAAACRAHCRKACDYANELTARAAADPVGAAREEARRQENEIGNAHYSHA